MNLLLSAFLLTLLPFAVPATPSSIPLHRHLPPDAALSHLPPLRRLAVASLSRAAHLKKPHKTADAPPSTSPLYPHSYGGYSFPISVGSPPQRLTVLLDTGSHLSWLPCTRRYQCANCSFPAAAGAAAVFLPNASSTARLVGCKNPSCSWIHSPAVISSCASCSADGGGGGCSRVCPPYLIIYGSGSTGGLLVQDVLRLPGRVDPKFVVGCSVLSQHQPPTGIAGFGRGAPSLTSQLGITKFSYCLLSRKYDDDAAVSGSIVFGGGDENNADDFQFAPFVKNPTTGMPYSVYYYLALEKITVGGESVKLPKNALTPNADGYGGAIIDSGTTFSYAESATFAAISTAFVRAIAGKYTRASDAEAGSGLSPCFALPASAATVSLPELALHFDGGAKMELPPENYFILAASPSSPAKALCLAMVTDSAISGGGGGGSLGPAIIIGGFQQQNYYVTYDLEKRRLGFRRQQCLRQ